MKIICPCCGEEIEIYVEDKKKPPRNFPKKKGKLDFYLT